MFRQAYLAVLSREQRLRVELEQVHSQVQVQPQVRTYTNEEPFELGLVEVPIFLSEQFDEQPTQFEPITQPSVGRDEIAGEARNIAVDATDPTENEIPRLGSRTPRNLAELVERNSPSQRATLEQWAEHSCPLIPPSEWMNRPIDHYIAAQGSTPQSYEESTVNPADLVLHPPALEQLDAAATNRPTRVETIAELEDIQEHFPEHLLRELAEEMLTSQPGQATDTKGKGREL